jgi:uncharacterized heparinase superfamily protein
MPGWKDPSWVARLSPPPAPAIRWQPVADWLPPGSQANTAAAMHAGRFTFINDERQLGWPPDWSGRGAPLLWQYNLHYLEWLWSLPTHERLTAASDWSQRHPPIPGAVGWAPYPTSLRLATLCLLASESNAAAAQLWPSIWRQAEHLSRRLEYHLRGNHLLENGIALAFAGACFAGPDADRWLSTGLALLRRELPEQVLGDGMHFERSPMYQVRLTHALALLANTGNAEVRRLVVAPLARMSAALAALCHPDGEIALFNDSACGVYPDPAAVNAFTAAALADEACATVPLQLPEAGYFVGRGKDGSAVFCDAGPLGPDYLPGHAHGDMFSFELSLGGRRVIVDSGTFDYLDSPMRRYCRSTAAHNTVTIDGGDQAEFWGAFRVGRRGRPHDVRFEHVADGFRLEGWHDGFRHLAAAALHRRAFRWHDDGVLVIHDSVSGRRSMDIAARLHLHPDCRVLDTTDTLVRAERGGAPFAIRFAGKATPRLEEGWYCPGFGIRQRNTVIVAEARGNAVEWRCAIAPGHGLEAAADGQSFEIAGKRYGS